MSAVQMADRVTPLNIDQGTKQARLRDHRKAVLHWMPCKIRVVPSSISIGTVLGRNLLQLKIFIASKMTTGIRFEP